jgi:hypothetical protein
MDNILFELKIKELKLLNKKFKVIEDCLVIEDGLQFLGCRFCYMVKPEPTRTGFKIPKGNLINAFESKTQQALPREVLINCWLCPHCGRLFQELLPDFETLGMDHVSL